MWKWKKDFFYFSKGDRIAIILLINLIVVSGGIFIFMNKFSFTDSIYKDKNEEIQTSFVQFEKDLKQIAPLEETSPEEDDKASTLAKPSKINKQKLELGQTIDINSASIATLTRIPGIGNTFAERIIDYRNLLGGFYSLEQLYEVKGITVHKFSNILPYLVLHKKHKLIKINKVSIDQIIHHPYFEEKHRQAIIELRTCYAIKDLSNLSDNENFSSRDIQRLAPYLSFE